MSIHSAFSVHVKDEFCRMIGLALKILRTGAHSEIDRAILDNCFRFLEHVKHDTAPQGPWPPLLRNRTRNEQAEAREIDRQYVEVMEAFRKAYREVFNDLLRAIGVAALRRGIELASKHQPVPDQVVQFFEKVHEYLSADWAHVEEAETASDA